MICSRYRATGGEELGGGGGQSRRAAVHNVREGRSPAELQEQLGAHSSARQNGDGDLGKRKGQDQQAFSEGDWRAQVQNPVSRCW